ncbi:acylneuraminate cytidylyltransferase family protein [Algoriphagus lutimaris]|uniref:acylneuraminate cytidylyltransferase family protein n=1 Tax=Algoriphagus lutimaris TaxID=613197 RepID=UPI00196B253D|nr:acylneuraminate cytidylyltransferase family protein [Algoriphagus lutimaris]MBN3518710.1 acylneuraminate cytidylyltransferase family protein [Algoriphagus lutimaris]
MRVLGLIPARGGSKGVPGKNIKFLGGKPLLAYTAESAFESKFLEKTILSTDDQNIAVVGESLGVEVPFIRPEKLALDQTPTLPVINHALDYYESLGEKFDVVCLLQVTSPFRPAGFIDQAILKFKNSKADSLVSVLEVPDHFNPHWTFEDSANGFLSIATGEKELITRRQELPKAYYRDGSLYLTKTSVIRNGSLYGDKLTYIVNDPEYYVNIDTLEDWEKAENWIKVKKSF